MNIPIPIVKTAIAAGALNNGDATVAEFDARDCAYVMLIIQTGDVAATAVLDESYLTGSNTSGSGHVQVTESISVAAHATNNNTLTCIWGAPATRFRYWDAVVSNNVAADFVIAAAFWLGYPQTSNPPPDSYFVPAFADGAGLVLA